MASSRQLYTGQRQQRQDTNNIYFILNAGNRLFFFCFLFFCFYFLQLYCPSGISPMGNSGFLPRAKPAATEWRYSAYGACWVFLCFHKPSNSDMDYGIFNVRTDVSARNCARGCTETVRESALTVDSGRKIPCCTGESNLRRQRAGPMPHQLSYVPTSAQANAGNISLDSMANTISGKINMKLSRMNFKT